jgi:exo-beta-1,3-glucanase (GH17 family)
MKIKNIILLIIISIVVSIGCTPKHNANKVNVEVTAEKILGDSNYLAISYGGYREKTRDIQPTIEELKDDLRILSAMGIKVLRTYNVHLPESENLLKAITQLKKENPAFEMYMMLGAWIDCKNAWTDLPPNHQEESERNAIEIEKAVTLTKEYPEIIKIIAVGNEAMVKWAASYYVQPGIILKWVKYLQGLKRNGDLPPTLWITSSDNFASWGGGGKEYHVADLNELIKSVDFISMHTYPMHDTHYNPDFWGLLEKDRALTDKEKIDVAMLRSKNYAIGQYESVKQYVASLGLKKPIHIGETGWATQSNEFYGNEGSRATDEYKSATYYWQMRDWTNKAGISCFYFEAFDEQWKDAANPLGSENHFGLINLNSEAKYALWSMVDKGVFKGLTRNGKPITKTYNGDETLMWKDIQVPPGLVKLAFRH